MLLSQRFASAGNDVGSKRRTIARLFAKNAVFYLCRSPSQSILTLPLEWSMNNTQVYNGERLNFSILGHAHATLSNLPRPKIRCMSFLLNGAKIFLSACEPSTPTAKEATTKLAKQLCRAKENINATVIMNDSERNSTIYPLTSFNIRTRNHKTFCTESSGQK